MTFLLCASGDISEWRLQNLYRIMNIMLNNLKMMTLLSLVRVNSF
jgi:hypothetical protein